MSYREIRVYHMEVKLWYRKNMAERNKLPYLLKCGLFCVPVDVIMHQMQCQREECRRKLSWYVYGCSIHGTEESDKNCKLTYKVPGQESKHGPPERQRNASAMCEIPQQISWRMEFKIIATGLLGEINRYKVHCLLSVPPGLTLNISTFSSQCNYVSCIS